MTSQFSAGLNNTMNSYSKTYNSFSGIDMMVTMGGHLIGEIQGISYTVQREKAPVYVMGSADPVSFSRGKRGIAGSMIFMVFDRSAMLDAFGDTAFLAWVNEPAASVGSFVGAQTSVPSITVNGLTSLVGTFGSAVGNNGLNFVQLDKVLARPMYHDQILPFEVVITMASEYGNNASMKIHGVEILNVGSGMSIDDITTDESCTFIARGITPLQAYPPVTIPGFTVGQTDRV